MGPSPSDDSQSSDPILQLSASHSSTPAARPPSITTDAVIAEIGVTPTDSSAEQPLAPLGEANEHTDATRLTAVENRDATSLPEVEYADPAQLDSASSSPAEEASAESVISDARIVAADDNHSQSTTEAVIQAADATGQSIAAALTCQLPSDEVSFTHEPVPRSDSTDQPTAIDSSVDESADTASARQLTERTAADEQQPTSPIVHVSTADSDEQHTEMQTIITPNNGHSTTSPSVPPRTALHTAVPTVLTTFLTATDDISNTPTADSSLDDMPVNHNTVSETAPDALQTTAAEHTPPVAYPPSALIPTLSTTGLDSLLNFRSSGSSHSAVSSSSALTAALRALKHVLDHPLLPPARPDDTRRYQFDTLSRPKRAEVREARRSGSSSYDEMGGRLSEHDKLHRMLQEELVAIQQESAVLAAHYPLDPLNASMLQTDNDIDRVRLPRKERMDYTSAEHSRAINRVQRDRKKLKEDEAMSDLLTAVSSPLPSHTFPPLAVAANRNRLPAALSTIAMQADTIDWSKWE